MNKPQLLDGSVKRHPDGFGFFIPDDAAHADVYIPRQGMNGVMTNDRVRVAVEKEKGDERYRGEVVEVLSRALKRALGSFKPNGTGRGILEDKSFAWGEDLNVSVPPELKPKPGEIVVAQIEEYPGSTRGFWGRVISIIGDVADPLNDSVRILAAHMIPYEFSAEAIKEAKALSPEVTEKDFAGRRDLRGLPIVTIDGQTAKDFDDAVFVEKTPAGFHLIVGHRRRQSLRQTGFGHRRRRLLARDVQLLPGLRVADAARSAQQRTVFAEAQRESSGVDRRHSVRPPG